jgi:uncharacterized protein (TIGR02996 family)
MMGVYFVYRCPYNGPTEKYIKRFDDATVLDWFRRIWVPVPEDAAWPHARELLGTEVYSFAALFLGIHESNAPPPATIEEAANGVMSMYHGAIRYEEHCVQLLTDDDELTMCWYLFDDVFLKEHPGLAEYLLYEPEVLPDGAGPEGWKPRGVRSRLEWPGGSGSGSLFSLHLTPSDDCNLADLQDGVIDRHRGMRVGDICRVLLTRDAKEVFRWSDLHPALFQADLVTDPVELAFVRAIREAPGEAVNWMAYTDWLAEHGKPAAGLHLLRLALGRMYGETDQRVHVGEHVVQVYFPDSHDVFDQWILFDDLWASAHPVLADALLRFATRWDVLSTGDERALG